MQKEARKKVYEFVHDTLGVKMTPEQRDVMKQLLIANGNAMAEDLLGRVAELEHQVEVLSIYKKKQYEHGRT